MNATAKIFVLSAILAVGRSTIAGAVEPGGDASNGGVAGDVPSTLVEEAAEQLNDGRFMVRRFAAERLRSWDTRSVPVLRKTLREGTLEATETAAAILADIALRNAPSRDGGAYDALRARIESVPSAATLTASAAAEDIAEHRGRIAVERLRRRGADIGLGLVMSQGEKARSRERMVIDEDFDDSPATLSWLRWLRGVPMIVLQDRHITTSLAESLIDIDAASLLVVDCELSPDTLRVLGQWQSLRSLEVRYTDLDPSSLRSWARQRTLQSVYVMGAGLTEDDIVELRGADPTLAIEFKRGGFLGVMSSLRGGVCEISQVVPGSGAERAGLKEHDIIVRIGGSPVNDFDELRRLIGQLDSEHETSLMYVRDNNIFETRIKLGRM